MRTDIFIKQGRGGFRFSAATLASIALPPAPKAAATLDQRQRPSSTTRSEAHSKTPAARRLSRDGAPPNAGTSTVSRGDAMGDKNRKQPDRVAYPKGSRRAADMVPEEKVLLFHGRLPVGDITVVAGLPAKGKSALIYLAVAEMDVVTIFVTTEEADKTVWRPRLEAAGMDLSKAFHHPEVKFSRDPADLAYLAALVDRYEAKVIAVDPFTNHLRDASVSRDDQVRRVLEPYLELIAEKGLVLLLQLHVLRSVNAKAHPLTAVPAGIVSVAKAVYLFGDDPAIGADPGMRILACADKFNFGPLPRSMRFEYDTKPVFVRAADTGLMVVKDVGCWRYLGETTVSAKALLVTLTPETKDRKSDRVAYLLVDVLRDGPQPLSLIRAAMLDQEPPISWRTVERVANEMGIVVASDPADSRRKLWDLPAHTRADLEEMTGPDDEITITEVDIPEFPPPETGGDDHAEPI